MEQLSIFSNAKYLIDTSSILSQKAGEPNRRSVNRSMWNRIDECIRDGMIVTCSEISEEVKDERIRQWLIQLQCHIIDLDDDVQANVRRIVTDNPKMIDFSNSGSSSGDAFLIATAMKYGYTIITEENTTKQNKIPMICKKYNIETVNIIGLCEKEGWVF